MFLGITIEEGENGGKDLFRKGSVQDLSSPFQSAPVFLRWKTLLEESRSPDVKDTRGIVTRCLAGWC
jgi:hypothetical protein